MKGQDARRKPDRTTAAPQADITPYHVVELFAQHASRALRPNEVQCYDTSVVINAIRGARPRQRTISADLRERRATIAALRKMIEVRKAECCPRTESLPILPPGISEEEALMLAGNPNGMAVLKQLEDALAAAEGTLVGYIDPNAGERTGSAWYKSLYFIADAIEKAWRAARNSTVSYDKRGPLVRVIVAALALAKIDKTPDAVAEALRRRQARR